MELAWKRCSFIIRKLEEMSKELAANQLNETLIETYGRMEERFEFLGGYDYESTTENSYRIGILL